MTWINHFLLKWPWIPIQSPLWSKDRPPNPTGGLWVRPPNHEEGMLYCTLGCGSFNGRYKQCEDIKASVSVTTLRLHLPDVRIEAAVESVRYYSYIQTIITSLIHMKAHFSLPLWVWPLEAAMNSKAVRRLVVQPRWFFKHHDAFRFLCSFAPLSEWKRTVKQPQIDSDEILME